MCLMLETAQFKFELLIFSVLIPLFWSCILILCKTGSLSKSFFDCPGSKVVSVHDHFAEFKIYLL